MNKADTVSTTTTNPSPRPNTGIGGLLDGSRRPVFGPASGQRNRSWGLVTLAALLTLGSGLGVAAYGLNAGEKESVIAVSGPIAKGHVIGREDLVTTSASGVGGAFPAGQVATVVGKSAAVDLVSGQILTSAMLSASQVPGPGKATVGLALDPSRVPGAGLGAGDVVDVIAVSAGDGGPGGKALDSPGVLARGAQVLAVAGAATAGGQVLLTVVVDVAAAARIAAYSTANRVAVVQTAPPGAGSGR